VEETRPVGGAATRAALSWSCRAVPSLGYETFRHDKSAYLLSADISREGILFITLSVYWPGSVILTKKYDVSYN